MAQKYLMALDYVDLHANSVLKKHAKKRPLGDIETKHRYTPTQPVLSCRTVDIDVSGTRTYRPKSSADIISEQHALIHNIYTKARNIASAPPRRSKTPRKSVAKDNSQNKENNNLKSVEVQGRPLTSLSQRPSEHSSNRGNTSNKRPKTTGQIKNNKTVHDSFMVVHADRELIETRRSYRSLTDKIHKHWEPENHDLNTGTYQRGKKPPGVPSVDSWLTFSGTQNEQSQGIVDAFAEHVLESFLDDSEDSSDSEQEDLETANDYYNVEGGVGSRIAQQLQKGDKIRIGINGNIQSQDLKVKKWSKEDSYVKPEEDEFKENMAKNDNMVIPLSWDDQVQASEAKIITPRGPPIDRSSQSLCTSKPVVFTKLLPNDVNTGTASSMGNRKDGFRVKQRKKTKPCIDGKERDNKITVVTIDSKSEAEEKKIESLTVDEVIKQNCDSKNKEKQNGHHEDVEKHSVTFSLAEPNGHGQDGLYSPSKISIVSSGSSEQRHPKVKPSQPTFSTKYQEVDLDIIGTLSVPNGQRPLSSESTGNPPSIYGNKSPYIPKQVQGRVGSARSSRSGLKSAKSTQRSLGSSSLVSMTGYRQNEAEYIQIATPVKNPNPGQQKKNTEYQQQGMSSDVPRGHMAYSGIREPVPSPELELDDEFIENSEGPQPPSVQIKTIIKPSAQALSISIPTGEFTDSALNSPTRGTGTDASPQVRRAKDMRDEQIDQITTLLVDAIIGQNDDKTSSS
ncbi:uncharacterized protein LOC132734295 isoform X3 [Ruditapes philippinarum]|uniref:uncharacterized protein LOC132734295 isoform X3 n=1 Tax=Ruditapes philippinarum TaxID=129788 RepID=UPI00295A8BAC|nr:uncharacterized protein LOC132734295 isoform X3 [Ruditapes philippinarum]XP_060576987.1 uncharacterized protein LOC132734295 isoform X3 [Ruditapes philippinarum]